MDHLQILKRSLKVTWRYRALWVFGVILALVTPHRGGGSNGGASAGAPSGSGAVPGGPGLELSPEVLGVIIFVVLALVLLGILLGIAFAIARYISQTALLRMVDEHEQTGEQHNVGWGFRVGWSKASWRIFLINVVTGLPIAILSIGAILLSLSPLLLWITGSEVVGAVGTVGAIVLFLPVLLVVILVGTAISALREFFWRWCVFEDAGVMDSIRKGFALVRRNFRDVGIMWLLMVGVKVAWAALLIPLAILLLVMGLGMGGIPALVVGLLFSGAFQGAWSWIVGGALGILIFALVMGLPMLIAQGLMEVFSSTTWTLTYREARAIE